MQRPYSETWEFFKLNILLICCLCIAPTFVAAGPPELKEDENLLLFLKRLREERLFFLKNSPSSKKQISFESTQAAQGRFSRFLEFIAGKKYTFYDEAPFFVDDTLLCYFLKNNPKKILILRNCNRMTPAMLEAAGRCYEQIEELHIRAGFDLSQNIYPALKDSFKQLQKLNLEKFDGPTNEAELEAFSALRLRTLRLLSCKCINDTFLKNALEIDTLEELKLESLPTLTGTAFRDLSGLQLSHLGLVGCESLSPHVLSWVLLACPRLKALDMQHNLIYIESILSFLIEKQKTAYPGQRVPPVQVLSLAYSPHISKENLKTIAEKVPSLTALNLSGIEDVTPWLLEYFSKNLLFLKILSLRDCTQLTPVHMMNLQRFNMLEELDLSGCEGIELIQVALLLHNCPIVSLTLGRSFLFFRENIFILMAYLKKDFRDNTIKIQNLFIAYPHNCFKQSEPDLKKDHEVLQKSISTYSKKLRLSVEYPKN